MPNTQQPSAKAGTTLTWTAADNNQRTYTGTKAVLWDTGNLFGSTLFVNIPSAGYYWLTINLDNFNNAGNCQIGFIVNDLVIAHEVTTSITLGADPTHKAGTFTSGIFSANAGDNFKMYGWHTGGGSCQAYITAVKLLL